MLAQEYVPVLILVTIGFLMPVIVFFLTRYFRPKEYAGKNRKRGVYSLLMNKLYIQPSDAGMKNKTYECGEVPLGDANIQFHFQYYMYAIIFVTFDIVVMFLMIWALLLPFLSDYAKLFMAIFVIMMLICVHYALKKEEVVYL
jgi:NADH:ubiquinone oxidoreductase subunit 3 (subunit A)